MSDKMKRRIKDSVFVMLFSEHKYLVLLYCLLHPEDASVRPEDIKCITLEYSLVSGIFNDLGMLAGKKLIIYCL